VREMALLAARTDAPFIAWPVASPIGGVPGRLGRRCARARDRRALLQEQKPGTSRMVTARWMPQPIVADLVQPLGQHVLQEPMVRQRFEARCLWRTVTPLSSRPTMRLLVMATRKT
jgi:hypothetical protein